MWHVSNHQLTTPLTAGALHMDTQTEQFSSWIGNSERHSDILTLAPLVAMAATLNKTKLSISEGFELPPLWHWLYFLNPATQSALAADGHARKGDFLPPIELPRRMWAGDRKSVVQGKSVDLGGRRIITKKRQPYS